MTTPLVSNPFCAARFAPGTLPWIGEGELTRYLDQVCVAGARYQVVGAKGTGKTTLLVHLERGARARGWDVLRVRGSRGFVVPRRGALVLADEAEALGAVGRGLLRATATSLVVATHRDLGLPTLCEREVDAATAEALVALLGPARRPSREGLAASLARHRGNLREVFFELYDEVERERAACILPRFV